MPRDTATGARVLYQLGEGYRYWMLFKGGRDDLLCVEPQSWLINCPNAPFPREQTGFDYLQPDEARDYTATFRLERD